jgi:hypothetical protein
MKDNGPAVDCELSRSKVTFAVVKRSGELSSRELQIVLRSTGEFAIATSMRSWNHREPFELLASHLVQCGEVFPYF